MKRKVLLILIIVFSLIFSACSKKKLEDKIIEKVIESTTGIDIDNKKDSTTITSEQGTSQFGSNLKWPKDKMGSLPEIKGNILGIFEDKQSNGTSVTFESLKSEDAKEYIKKLKELGYKNGWESESSDGLTFSGYKEDNTEVLFMYNGGGGSLVYMVESNSAANAFQNEQSTDPTNIDMTDAVPWPKDFIENVPELEGKITSISSSGNNKYLSLEYVEKDHVLEYIEKIKSNGFTVDSYDSVSADYISYSSYNEKGEYISINWSNGGYTSLDLQKAD